jgi:PEP-CTERM motif
MTALAERAVHAAAVVAGLLALAPSASWAETSSLNAALVVTTVMTHPAPREDYSRPTYLSLVDSPAAREPIHLVDHAQTSNGGTADVEFLGRIGMLKAYAAASHPYCCTIGGQLVTTGFSNATVDAIFTDTVAVTGGGLAEGDAVQYTVGLSISGTISSPSFEMGGHVGVYGVAEVRLEDRTTREIVTLRWIAGNQAPGLYELTLNTRVGHQLSITGMLNVGASVDSSAVTTRSGEADFYHSAIYSLTPSVAGLNTVGASGVDFLAPVPEPASWAVMLAGLAALGGAVRVRRTRPQAG